MVETHQHVVEDISERIQTITLDETVRVVEIQHPGDGRGVERETVEAYVGNLEHGTDAFTTDLDSMLTGAETWQGNGHLYELGDGRVSFYPPRWHDELADAADLREYLRVLGADAEGTPGGDREAVTEDGVLEDMLLDAAAAIGGMDRENAREQLFDLRHEGEIEQYPSQHENPWVQLS